MLLPLLLVALLAVIVSGTQGLVEARQRWNVVDQAYDQLAKQFNPDDLGYGPELMFEDDSEQPMTYALLLSADSLHYKVTQDAATRARIEQAYTWLIDNADLNGDGVPGWGFPDAWDAFSDGSTNPSNYPYTITTAEVLNGFLDMLDSPYPLADSERQRILDLMKTVGQLWCSDYWQDLETDLGPAGYFWYGIEPRDAYFASNVSSMMLASLTRLSEEQRGAFDSQDYQHMADCVDKAARGMVYGVHWRGSGRPFWLRGTAHEDNLIAESSYYDRVDDLVHHAYTVFGMEVYRALAGRVALPWTTEQALLSFDVYWVDDVLLLLPPNQSDGLGDPAELMGAGAWLAFINRWSNDPDLKYDSVQYVLDHYGEWPQIQVFPPPAFSDTAFYPRYAAHVLWGLGYYFAD